MKKIITFFASLGALLLFLKPRTKTNARVQQQKLDDIKETLETIEKSPVSDDIQARSNERYSKASTFFKNKD